MIHLLAQLGSVAGFGLLAAAMARTQEDLFGRELPRSVGRLLRALGGLLLAAVLALLVAWQGWGLGLVMYSGHTSLAAGLVLAALILRGRRRTRA